VIRDHAEGLIDRWVDGDEVEFIGQFARPLPKGSDQERPVSRSCLTMPVNKNQPDRVVAE